MVKTAPRFCTLCQQLQQNVSKEEIKSSLVANGWQASDIEEGFNSLNSGVSKAPVQDTLIQPPQFDD